MHVVRPPADTTSARASFTCLREGHSDCQPCSNALYNKDVIWGQHQCLPLMSRDKHLVRYHDCMYCRLLPGTAAGAALCNAFRVLRRDHAQAGAARLKFHSTVLLPQEATIQRSWRPASVTHVNLPARSGAPPTLAASSGRRRSRRGRGAAAPMRLLKPLVSRLFLSCRAARDRISKH